MLQTRWYCHSRGIRCQEKGGALKKCVPILRGAVRAKADGPAPEAEGVGWRRGSPPNPCSWVFNQIQARPGKGHEYGRLVDTSVSVSTALHNNLKVVCGFECGYIRDIWVARSNDFLQLG